MDTIDVAELIARYDHADHVAKADAYFAKAEQNPYFWRKPLYTGHEASALLRQFAQVVGHLDLYPGARLLDFGAGSCWSSRMFAYMSCSVTAVDVSVKALKLGEAILAKDPIRDAIDLSFLPYDGVKIGLEDGTVDRIVCLDCFHHVPDQAATLADFYRLLRPGGIVGFSEPGPRHSLTIQSQAEMRNYGVIENDIHLDKVAEISKAIGFSDILVSHATSPVLLDLDGFQALVSGDVAAAAAKQAIDRDAPHHDNIRCFFLRKPGGPSFIDDSRSGQDLRCQLSVELAREGDSITGSLSVKNTGLVTWLGREVVMGQVNIGVHLFDADGKMVDLDYARIPLKHGLKPGESDTLVFALPHPGHGGLLVFDGVSEGVTWFEALPGNTVLTAPIP